jgi:hypothetical protein
MKHDHNGDEPIIAERRWREPPRDDAQPLWRLVLALGAGLAVAALIAWWWMNKASDGGASKTEPAEVLSPEVRPDAFPEERIEDAPLPPARDLKSDAAAQTPVPPSTASEPAADAKQAATPEAVPEAVPESAAQPPVVTPAPVSVRFTSPDAQVQIELRGPLESSPVVIGKAGAVLDVAPGTYRVVASGSQLETFEQDVTFVGGRPLEYTVELCAERKHQRENLAGQIVEERECVSAAECESLFTILSEHANELVKDRDFRTQQCAKWRPNSVPEGRWTLDINCGGATLASACRVEIREGACTFAEAHRTLRGTACPRVDLK